MTWYEEQAEVEHDARCDALRNEIVCEARLRARAEEDRDAHRTRADAAEAECARLRAYIDVASGEAERVLARMEAAARTFVRVREERDAAIAARDALAGAVAAVRDARAAASAAGARYSAAWDAVDAMPPTALQSEGIAAALRVSYEAQDALVAALDALLTATPVAMVRADVVRRYVRAVENAVSAAEMMGAMRDLDAALAAAGGGR